MANGTSRVSHDNAPLENADRREGTDDAPPKRIAPGDPAAGGVAEDEDVDETSAGGLRYPDDRGGNGR
jgi:hypothetical protein